MAEFIYHPRGVCSREFVISYEGNKVTGLTVKGGCHGNLQGIGKLVEGMDFDEVIRRLKGIKCGFKPTSCPDQIAEALFALKGQN